MMVSFVIGLLLCSSSWAYESRYRFGFENSYNFRPLSTSENQEGGPIVSPRSKSQETIRTTFTNPSPFRWFQELYYANANCEGQPYRAFDFVLGECFKDSPTSSFKFDLNSGGDVMLSAEYADDHCGKMSHNETDPFVASIYTGPQTSAPCIANPFNNQVDGFPTSFRTLLYESAYAPTYPTSGQVSRIHVMRGCTSQMVSANWHSLDTCLSQIAAELDDSFDKDSKRFRFTCEGGFPDIHGYLDNQCKIPSRKYEPVVGVYKPRCDPMWAPFTKFTPAQNAQETNGYVTTICYTAPPAPVSTKSPMASMSPPVSTTAPAPVPVRGPTMKPVAPTRPIGLVHPPTNSPALGPAVSSGPDEVSPVNGDGGGSGNKDIGNLLQLNSLSTELLIIIIVSNIAFCLCATTVVCFLCLRLRSQDSLNRDLMQSFVQLVERNGRALRNMQEKFSNRMRRSQHVSKARETEMRERETRGLLSASRSGDGSKTIKSDDRKNRKNDSKSGQNKKGSARSFRDEEEGDGYDDEEYDNTDFDFDDDT